MADDLNSAPEAETDDLRASLEAAFANPEPAAEASPDIPATESDPIAEEAAREYNRDEQGRFAAAEKAAQKAAENAQEAVKAPEAPKATEQPQAAPEAPQADAEAPRPPPGWSPAAKAAFATLPAEVQQAVAKREQEVNNGFAKLAEYKPIERYVEMARRGGTTLDKALENYVGIEQLLRTDIARGFEQIARNIGVSPVEMAQKILAAHGHSGNQGTGEAPQPQVHQPVQDIRSLVQQELAQVQTQAQIDAATEAFLGDPKNLYAQNVVDDMLPLISQRRQSVRESYADTLKWAYEKACWANDEVRPLLINQQVEAATRPQAEAATQARAAARSITGSPTPGASPGENLPADDLRSELVRQFAAHGGRV